MQVSVEETGNLQRRITVEIPRDRIEGEIETRLQSLAREARIDGFRPGKVPVRVIRERFGDRVREEVEAEVVRSTYQDAITQENLRPAGDPQVGAIENTADSGFRYTATFDVFPDVRIDSLAKVKILRPVVEITEQDLDGMVETLRKQRASWIPADRAAETGDRVVINYHGALESGDFEGNEGKDVPLELGSGAMIPGFEQGLVGARAGESRVLDLSFPKDYHNRSLAGAPVKFDVEILSVSAPELPDLDDEFVRGFGIADGDMGEFRDQVKANMQRELDQAVKNRLKAQVMDGMLAANPLEVPRSLVEKELAGMAESELAPAERETKAERRVALGLLLSEYIKAHDVRPDPERVRRSVERIAEGYEQPDEVVKWYYSNRDQLAQVEMLVLEEQVVDLVVESADVTDEKTGFNALLHPEKA